MTYYRAIPLLTAPLLLLFFAKVENATTISLKSALVLEVTNVNQQEPSEPKAITWASASARHRFWKDHPNCGHIETRLCV